MARRDWIKVIEYSELKPHVAEGTGKLLAVFTVQLAPSGLEVQCIRHVRYSNGDVFMLPSYRTNALEEYGLSAQSFFRIRSKRKSQKFQLALEEALIRDALPGPLLISKECMPRIPTATRRSALRALAPSWSIEDAAHRYINQTKNRN